MLILGISSTIEQSGVFSLLEPEVSFGKKAVGATELDSLIGVEVITIFLLEAIGSCSDFVCFLKIAACINSLSFGVFSFLRYACICSI